MAHGIWHYKDGCPKASFTAWETLGGFGLPNTLHFKLRHYLI
jgi:hypothetical protein